MMQAILRITSYHKNALGADALKSFTVSGGTFGRSNHNDWVLPDPERVISGTHGKIFFQEDQFWLRDESTNGIRTGPNKSNIGKGNAIPLRSGMRLVLGDYEITVDLDDDPKSNDLNGAGDHELAELNSNISHNDFDPLNAFQSGSSQRKHNPRPYPFAADHAAKPAESDILNSSKGNELEDPFRPPKIKHREAIDFQTPSEDLLEEIPDDWDNTGLLRIEKSSKAPKQQQELAPKSNNPIPDATFGSTAQPSSTYRESSLAEQQTLSPKDGEDSVNSEPLLLFLKAAGIDCRPSGHKEASELAVQLGTMFRDLTDGLMALLRVRAELKNELRLQRTTIHQVQNNPLKIAGTADDAFKIIFSLKSSGYLDPTTAVTEAVHDLKMHQVALLAAMHESFNHFVARLAPENFYADEHREHFLNAISLKSSNSKCWNHYSDFYDKNLRNVNNAFRNVIQHDFVETYEKQMARASLKEKANV